MDCSTTTWRDVDNNGTGGAHTIEGKLSKTSEEAGLPFKAKRRMQKEHVVAEARCQKITIFEFHVHS